MFQSTRPHGARPAGYRAMLDRQWVSIHAPARGATFESAEARAEQLFQSTRPHGARRLQVVGLRNMSQFQSTRPHGARLF